jgi:hypothetical protein
MVRKLTTEEFISKAKNIHNDKYNYDRVVYIKTLCKVEIFCNYHKKYFLLEPAYHIGPKQRGCPICGKEKTKESLNKRAKAKKLSTEEFISKSKNIHNNKYDYSKVNYLGDNKKVEIICPIHKTFWQRAGAHIAGHGCRKCYNATISARVRITTEQFIKECQLKHNNKYIYENTVYNSNNDKIQITCPIHGLFYLIAINHLRGCGCEKCYKENNFNRTLNIRTKNFIDKSTKIHNNKYDYSKVNYKRKSDKVEIICPIHNSFWQTASDHLSGSDCPKCYHSISKPEIEWLNLLNIPDDNEHRNCLIKIGSHHYRPDGFDPITNTIYEFNGDYYHGNPEIYNPDDYNSVTHCTFGELYEKTLEKEQILKEAGYTVISIWESDYNRQNSQ